MSMSNCLKNNGSVKNRDPFFDNLRAILIFLVVLCHGITNVRSYSNVITVLHEIILCFLMYLFVFVTGYFAKSMAEQNNPKRTRIINLFLLYTICQLGKMPITGATSFLAPTYANWYLLVMVIWYTILPTVARIKPAYVLVFSVLCAILLGIDPKATAMLQFSRLVCFFPFFILGYYCATEQKFIQAMNAIRSKNFRILGFVCFAAGSLFCIVYWVDKCPIGIYQNYRTYEQMKMAPMTGMMFREVQFLLSFIMGFGFLAFIPRRKTFFTSLGTRTLSVYILHTFLYPVIINYSDFFPKLGERSGTFLIIAVLSVIVTALTGNKWVAIIFDKFMSIDFGFVLKEKD